MALCPLLLLYTAFQWDTARLDKAIGRSGPAPKSVGLFGATWLGLLKAGKQAGLSLVRSASALLCPQRLWFPDTVSSRDCIPPQLKKH